MDIASIFRKVELLQNIMKFLAILLSPVAKPEKTLRLQSLCVSALYIEKNWMHGVKDLCAAPPDGSKPLIRGWELRFCKIYVESLEIRLEIRGESKKNRDLAAIVYNEALRSLYYLWKGNLSADKVLRAL